MKKTLDVSQMIELRKLGYMKQWITEEQFNELTDQQKEVWYKWIRDHHYTFGEIYTHILSTSYPKWTTLNFPSIGEMIEFLEEHTRDQEYFSIRMERAASDGFAFPRGTLITQMDGVGVEIEDEPVLCDALWEAVVECLKKHES